MAASEVEPGKSLEKYTSATFGATQVTAFVPLLYRDYNCCKIKTGCSFLMVHYVNFCDIYIDSCLGEVLITLSNKIQISAATYVLRILDIVELLVLNLDAKNLYPCYIVRCTHLLQNIDQHIKCLRGKLNM